MRNQVSRVFPDFIMIGAGKVGSTSIYEFFVDHPQVCIAAQKETYYFIPADQREALKPWGAITSEVEYTKQFAHAQPDQIWGEISTNYYAYPESAALIHQAIPDVKLIAVLRNPIDRAYSSFQMRLREVGDVASFETELNHPNSPQTARGFYYKLLLPYFERFPRQQIRVLFFDDFVKDQQAFFDQLCAFLDIPPLPIKTQYHGRKGGTPSSLWLHRLLSTDNLLRRVGATLLKPFLGEKHRRTIREAMLARNIQKKQLPAALREQLSALYRDDLRQLEQLLETDLGHWR
ncbi:MAG: sulfotransferase [Synechococcales bacterium]|nr:sulfotransferase [Synechococcales bacterium]